MHADKAPHPIVVIAVVLSASLISGVIGLGRMIAWMWYMALHLTYYRQGPGKLTFSDKGPNVLLWDGGRLAFSVSNRMFARKTRLNHDEAALVIQSIRELDNELDPAALRWDRLMPQMRLQWQNQTYRCWTVPALNLRRRPDDVTLDSEVRWQPVA